MIFSELYSAYYNAVAGILTKALASEVDEKELRQQVLENAFSESALTILPALKSGKWPLLRDDLSPVVEHVPTMPLTTLEKRWLKSLLDDPRLRLFDVTFPDLDDVVPLFTCQDYKMYDRYGDGDPYEDEIYIRNFKTMYSAIKEERPVKITMINRHGKPAWARFLPKRFEYSMKDDKFRVIVTGCKFKQFNMGRIQTCEFYTNPGSWRKTPKTERRKNLVLTITDERNAMERAMLHFAHFEKQAERIDDRHYTLRLKYYENDETELVIRILSFGPYVRVKEPQSFVNLIKERLISQKSCELR